MCRLCANTIPFQMRSLSSCGFGDLRVPRTNPPGRYSRHAGDVTNISPRLEPVGSWMSNQVWAEVPMPTAGAEKHRSRGFRRGKRTVPKHVLEGVRPHQRLQAALFLSCLHLSSPPTAAFPLRAVLFLQLSCCLGFTSTFSSLFQDPIKPFYSEGKKMIFSCRECHLYY